MVIEVSKYGTVKGGVCDGAHMARANREKGAEIYLDELKRMKYLNPLGGINLILFSLPKTSENEIMKIGDKYGAEFENGYRRARDDVGKNLYQSKRSFTLRSLKTLFEEICSFEFGVSAETPLSIISGEGVFGYAPPHQPLIYEAKKRDRVFENDQ